MGVEEQSAKPFDFSEEVTAESRKLHNKKFYNLLYPLHTSSVTTDQIGSLRSTHQNTKYTYTIVVKL